MAEVMVEKPCARCGETLSLDSFQKRKTARHGRGSYCYPCARAMSSETDKRRKLDAVRTESRSEYLKGYRRRTHLARFYGMTEQEYDERVASQNGRCAICQRTPSGEGRHGRLAVDHDHETGEVRRLLCTQCNTMLGMAGDDIEVLMSGVAYLMEHENVREMTS